MLATGNLVLIFALALVLAVTATPVARRVALRTGFVDQPSARKLHGTPIPLLGGLAIYAAVAGALLLYSDRHEITEVIGILLGATWVSMWGLWDDRNGLRATIKLLAQVAAAAILIEVGVHTRLPMIPDWADVVLTVLWVVGITNAFNLLDNMDGLSSGIGAVAAGYFLLLAALSGQYLVGAFAAALLGACLGFVYYNFNPARIFMGDSGSLFLGFMMAALGIKMRFPTNVTWVTWMVPVLVLGVPIFDTTLVVVSRLRRGLNPLTTPGKDHLSHRLVSLGWTRREAVMVLFLAGCALGGIALFVSAATLWTAYAVAAVVAAAALYCLVWLERHAPGGVSEA
jgi:UDP-GlcNAc:undecaprenyl-phosphate GlcNAc-1-phosphate transferase